MILMDKIDRPLRILTLILFIIVNLVVGHREHKVHNITLYPDKHSWCHVLPIKQVISYSGCESVQIDNNVCVGACFSYSIPHTEPSDPGEVIVPYCDSCQPSEIEWRHVQLKCDQQNDDPDSPDGELLKRVQIIKNCSCTSCEKDKYLQQKLLGYNSNNDNDDDNDLLHNENNIPDLLNILQIRNETKNYNLTKNNDLKSLLNHHIITLLKNIQADNLQKDKEQLINALRIVQYDQLNNIDNNYNNHHNNDNNIAEFVDSLNTENIELDIPHLREILIKYEESKNLEKIKKQNILLNNDNIDILSNHNDNINTNIDDHNKHNNNHRHHHHHHHHLQSILPKTDNEQIDDKMNLLTTDKSLLLLHQNQINHHHHHSHHNHHNHQHHNHDNKDHTTISSIPTISTTLINDIKENNDNNDNNNTNNNHQNHHHHHHIGEKIDEIHHHGHLIRGPHNSLIIKPENDDNDKILIKPTLSSSSSSLLSASTVIQQHRIHEKLDVNPHELKPNHAGTLLSYSSHSSSSSDGGSKSKNLI